MCEDACRCMKDMLQPVPQFLTSDSMYWSSECIRRAVGNDCS